MAAAPVSERAPTVERTLLGATSTACPSCWPRVAPARATGVRQAVWSGSVGRPKDVGRGEPRQPAWLEQEPVELDDLEARVLYRRAGVAIEVATAGDAGPDRVDAALP